MMLESWHTPEEQGAGSLRMDRRAMLTVSGALVMAAATAGGTEAREAGALSSVASRPTVILQDRRVLLPEGLPSRLGGNVVRVLQLEADPVRMWRGEHAALLADPRTRLVGVTPWIEFVMIQGLAAESRRRVHYQRHDAGADAMVWLIA